MFASFAQHGLRRLNVSAWPAFLLCVLLLFPVAAPSASLRGEELARGRLEELLSGVDNPQSVSELRAIQDRLQQLCQELIPTTVGVRIGPAHGSGVIISADGYVLTAAHVAGKPGQRVTLILHDDREVRGRTLGMNRNVDAGMIKIEDPCPWTSDGRWPHAEMAKAGEVEPGQWCLGMGHPGGHEDGRKPVVRFGRVLSSSDSLIVTDCTLIGGDSGGPLFNTQGQVVGIHSRISGPLTSNMHVPMLAFRQSWDRMLASETWGHLPGQQPFIGVQGVVTSDRAQIARVFPDTPAARAGIRPGDIITRFDDKEVTNFASLSELVQNTLPGETVEIELVRNNQTVKLQLTVGEVGE